jgi:hypothetical protein
MKCGSVSSTACRSFDSSIYRDSSHGAHNSEQRRNQDGHACPLEPALKQFLSFQRRSLHAVHHVAGRDS